MRILQKLHNMQLTEQFSKTFSEVRKYSILAAVLFISFVSLVIFKVEISKQFVLQPSPNGTTLEKFAQNITAKCTSGSPLNTTIFSGENPVNQEEKLYEEIASAFDKKSCLSRYTHSLYKKNQPYKPSPYLISKLRAYHDLHSRCGPHTSSYRQLIRKIARSSSNNNYTTRCKYIVWSPANGLGNRIVSITSTFLYALLKSRVLLVEFGPEMDDLFCEPFPNSTWVLPENFPHKRRWNNIPSFENIPHLGDVGFKPPIVHINLQHGNDDSFIHHFHCNDTQSILDRVPFLISRSDQYFVPSLFLIPSFTVDLNRMFPQKGGVFHLLGHYLFNPSNNVWGLITRFYQAYLANADEKIGLQIRVFSQENISYEKIMTQILHCTLHNNILPSFGMNESHSQNLTLKSKAVLVSSLYPQFSEILRSMYWLKPTLTGDVVGIYQPSHEEFQKFGDNMHNVKAWAEMYLLSLCDVVVTSGQSTFGYVAQGLAGVKPWILSKIDGSDVRGLACKRGVSSEPCFHVGVKDECNGKKIGNVTAVNSHFRACEDVWWGFKLVND